jgi:V/A-type H+-transporting ATPase subunit K
MEKEKRNFKRKVSWSLAILLIVLFMAGIPAVTGVMAQSNTAGTEPAAQEVSQAKASVMAFGLIAAAVAFGFGAIGAGIAIANVGAAAMGAIAEKPEIGANALIFIALAEGLVVFGFITALMILGKI